MIYICSVLTGVLTFCFFVFQGKTGYTVLFGNVKIWENVSFIMLLCLIHNVFIYLTNTFTLLASISVLKKR